MKPSDLARATLPGAPTLSPDGATVVVPLRHVDLEADDYTSQLWLLTTDGSALPRQLTHAWRDGAARYSPDGRWLALVRVVRDDAGKPGKPQLWVLPTTGGEARCLTDHPLGVESPVWSPDSGRIAYLARVPEEGRYGTVEGRGPEKEPPRRITRLFYRVDGLGFMLDRPRQVFVVDARAEDAEPTQVTEGDFDHGDVDWSPDGEWLAFSSARHPERCNDMRSDVWVCRPDGTALRALTDGGLNVGQPQFGPDSARVYFVGVEIGAHARGVVCRNTGLWSVPTDGSSGPRRLTDQERYNLGAPDGRIEVTPRGVLFPCENRGAVELVRVPLDGGEPELLIGGERQVLVATADRSGERIAAAVAAPDSWGEVLFRDADGSQRVLTGWSQPYRSTVGVLPQEELTTTAPDGYPVHGWVVRPAGPGPHPVLLMIHGGPYTQYGWRLFDEAQVYAGAGYAVVMGNPRGSSGYGEAHGQAIVGDVGARSATDLLALLDAAVKADDMDASRVGVLGGSHGGFMTTWMAAHHGDRFKAAISERAVNAIDSFSGASDIGWIFADDMYGADPAQQARQSPLRYADRIDIPMLIIHSEQDWRCPVEQAQRLFVALKRRGAQVEFLLFPGEGHELSRSGLPSHRVARFEAILDWWQRHL